VLARLQQATTLGALLLAALWAGLLLRAGHPGWAVAGALLVVGGYALVLALEFALLRAAHGDDPTPRATPAQLARAWWGEVHTAPAVFCWRQPFFSGRYADTVPPEEPGRASQGTMPASPRPATPERAADSARPRGVLLVHGFVCNRGLWNPWLARLRAAGVPVVAVNLEPVFGSIDDYVPCIEAAVRRLERHTGRPPVVVAHSMGGLALRRWWAAQGSDAARVHHAITIGTPHHGTWLARFALSPNGRQMQQRSPWLQALAASEPAARRARFTCFYGHCDNIVFPPRTATLPDARNHHIPGVAHVHMAACDEPWQELQRRLAEP